MTGKTKIFWAIAMQIGIVLVCSYLFSTSVHGAELPIKLRGSDFQGGAQKQFGSSFYSREGVNLIYATPTGPLSVMSASIVLDKSPTAPMVLSLEAMDDDAPQKCRVAITLNNHALWSAPSGFPDGQWQIKRFSIPDGLLKTGTNRLTITNLEPNGSAGQPPWFMIARCVLAGADYHLPVIAAAKFEVQIPDHSRAFPEPLAAGQEPGFKFRGTKGYAWTPEQYLEEIPWLVKFKMNFLMNCYVSMFTPERPWKNEWWKPLSKEKAAAYAKVIQSCQDSGITFCFCMNPQLACVRPLVSTNTADVDLLYEHYAWAQSLGVKWFSICVDDVGWGNKGPAQVAVEDANLVNTVVTRLRQNNPQAQMIFCPGPYSGDGMQPDQHTYLQTLGRDLDPQVYVFWTGDGVVGQHITVKAATSYKLAVNHRLFLWDNYPVNDAAPTLSLGPVSGRDPGLDQLIDGYMGNPMATQNEANRIPLATCADFSYNPSAYDPARSIGQTILLLAKTPAQQRCLQELIETYPGFIVTGGNTGTNPVRDKFNSLSGKSDFTAAQQLLHRVEKLVSQMEKDFPAQFDNAKKTVADDVAWMKQKSNGTK